MHIVVGDRTARGRLGVDGDRRQAEWSDVDRYRCRFRRHRVFDRLNELRHEPAIVGQPVNEI